MARFIDLEKGGFVFFDPEFGILGIRYEKTGLDVQLTDDERRRLADDLRKDPRP